jgi:hypothetical protein
LQVGVSAWDWPYAAATIEVARRGTSGVIERRLLDLRIRLTPFANVPSAKLFLDQTASL